MVRSCSNNGQQEITGSGEITEITGASYCYVGGNTESRRTNKSMDGNVWDDLAEDMDRRTALEAWLLSRTEGNESSLKPSSSVQAWRSL